MRTCQVVFPIRIHTFQSGWGQLNFKSVIFFENPLVTNCMTGWAEIDMGISLPVFLSLSLSLFLSLSLSLSFSLPDCNFSFS